MKVYVSGWGYRAVTGDYSHTDKISRSIQIRKFLGRKGLLAFQIVLSAMESECSITLFFCPPDTGNCLATKKTEY